jgi:heme/copper-type cytochrome/quinol oxidase subunit 2
MNRKRVIRLTLLAASAGAALLWWSMPVLAQCAMCKNAITGSPEAAKLSESLNFAIIVLLIPPVLIFCGFFVLAYRYRKARGAESQAQGDTEQGSQAGLVEAMQRKKSRKGRGETGGALA